MRRPKIPPRAHMNCSEPTPGCCPTLVQNPDGSFTFNPGNGSPPIILPKSCCPTLTPGPGTGYTFNPGDGSTPIIIPTLTFTGGIFTATANGASATVNLRGNLLQDLASVDLGYLLPLT